MGSAIAIVVPPPLAASAALMPPPAFSAIELIVAISGTLATEIVSLDLLPESAPPEPILPPSFRMNVTLRVDVDGVSELFEYPIARASAWTAAGDELKFKAIFSA